MTFVVVYNQVLIPDKGKKAKRSFGTIHSSIYLKVSVDVLMYSTVNQRNHYRPESVLARNGKARCYVSPALSELLEKDMSTLQILHDKVKEHVKKQTINENDIIALNRRVSRAKEATQYAEQQLEQRNKDLELQTQRCIELEAQMLQLMMPPTMA